MGTVTKSIGSGGGRDYSTLQAWEDALPANLVTDGNAQVGECYNDSEFTAKVNISGQTTNGTNNITLKAASGQAFYDHANKLTNRLAYNQSNGVAVRTTTGYDTAVVVVGSNNVTIEGLQLKATGTGTAGISVSGSPSGFVVRKCIVSAVSRSNLNDGVVRISGATSNYVINSLIIVDSNSACTAVIVIAGANAINCTVVRPSNRTAGGRLARAAYNTSTIKNCAFFGFTTSAAGTYAADGHNVTDHTSAPGSTSNITSATYANQFVQSSTGSSVEDFRIVGTGADLDDAGVTDTTNIPAGDDIVGQTRSTWDVGCWEYVSAGITLTAAQGTYTLTGQSVNLTIARRVTAEQGTYTLTGQNVTLRQGKTLTAEQGTYTLTGQSASLLVSRQITLAQGSYTLTGQDVTLTKSGGDKTLTAVQGTYTLTGYDVSLSLARKLTAEQGTYTLNGQDVGLSRNGRVLQAAQGTYTLNGQEVTLNYSGQPPNAYDIVLARRRLRK